MFFGDSTVGVSTWAGIQQWRSVRHRLEFWQLGVGGLWGIFGKLCTSLDNFHLGWGYADCLSLFI